MAQPEENYTYEVIKGVADYLLSRTKIRPQVGIVCGSGLGSLADFVTDVESFDYASIPNFPVSTVEGHAGRLLFGRIDCMEVMLMQGRFHHYEGYSLAKCSMPVRVMKLVGAQILIVTNAAGGIRPEFNVGDIMIINDHINWLGMAGNSPLRGPNDTRFGPRFPTVTDCYDPELIEKATKVANDMGIAKQVHKGVYTILGGPTYESIAELKLLHNLGADAVGMSTVHEVIVAKHCGMRVFAFSLITNKCVLDYNAPNKEANHEEVVGVGKARQNTCGELVRELLREITCGCGM